jgi:hypothetical protein
MSSIIKVNTVQDADGNNIINESGDVITVGASGDTVTVAGNVVKSNALQASDGGNVVSQSGTTITVGASGDTVALASGASQTGFGSNPFKNIVINGDMRVAQRATSAASITSDDYYTIDRFVTEIGSFGTWTQSQVSDAPTGQGYTYALKMDCTTAQGSPGSGNVMLIGQSIEGSMLQAIKQGTANAESTTLSFWHKHTKTGTNIVELLDADNTNAVSGSYTQSVSDTWEKATITFPANTSGAYGNDSARSLRIRFIIGSGTDYTSGTLATTWQTSITNANRYAGQVNNADSTSNNFIITGVQYEVGTSATDFEFLPLDIQTQRCERYYETSMTYGSYGQYAGQQPIAGVGSSTYGGSTSSAGGRQFRTWKRASPTVTLYHQDGTSGGIYRIHDAQKTTGNVASHINQNGFLFATKSSGFNSGYYYYYGYTAESEL